MEQEHKARFERTEPAVEPGKERVKVGTMTMRARSLTLGIGDLGAPPGSREWAIAVRAQIQVAIQDSSSDRQNLQTWLALMEKHQGYKSLEDAHGRKFASYEAFCVERLPYGLAKGGCPMVLNLPDDLWKEIRKNAAEIPV